MGIYVYLFYDVMEIRLTLGRFHGELHTKNSKSFIFSFQVLFVNGKKPNENIQI